MDNFKIGLFPLKIVLLPEALLTLHIFEERYKVLIKDCWTHNKPFGVNLKISSKIYDVGCTAEINDITKTYEDGRMDIIISGLKKYKLLNYDKSAKGYLVGEIKYINDEFKEDIDQKTLWNCVDIYNQIATTVNSITIEKLNQDDMKTKYPSFLLAQKSGLDITQRQVFLEMDSENKRLYYLLEHFQKILPVITDAEFVTRIIKNDGYYRPLKKL